MKPIKVKFTEKTIANYQHSWFQWLDGNGELHKKSWFKPDYEYGVVAVHTTRGGRTFYSVQRLNKNGYEDKRTHSHTFLREELVFLGDQNLDLKELL